MTGRRIPLVAGGVAALIPVVLFPLSWWIVGDRTEGSVRGRTHLQHLVTAPEVDAATGRLLVVASLVLGSAMSVALFRIVAENRNRRAAALVVASGWVVALGWGLWGRFLTVGAYGASMSAPVLPAAPLLVVLQVGAATVTFRLLRPPVAGS